MPSESRSKVFAFDRGAGAGHPSWVVRAAGGRRAREAGRKLWCPFDCHCDSARSITARISTLKITDLGNRCDHMFRSCERACKAGASPSAGCTSPRRPTSPRIIVNFPTKKHCRQPSRLECIDDGLRDLIARVRQLGIASIAVPPLGCGLGGLDWAEVRPLIERAFEVVPDVRVLIFEPGGR